MARMKIKKNDLVQVIAGKDKGLQGRVIAVYTETGRVLVGASTGSPSTPVPVASVASTPVASRSRRPPSTCPT